MLQLPQSSFDMIYMGGMSPRGRRPGFMHWRRRRKWAKVRVIWHGHVLGMDWLARVHGDWVKPRQVHIGLVRMMVVVVMLMWDMSVQAIFMDLRHSGCSHCHDVTGRLGRISYFSKPLYHVR